MTVRILPGHCINVLNSLPANSVQCIVTSPPYYGLRAYNTPPQVWDGAADCPHEWGDGGTIRKSIRNGQGATTLQESGPHGTRAHGEQLVEKLSANVITSQSTGARCQLCGAWRGELGQEPSALVFVAHLVQVFEAARRVLRDDGTLWVNLGDSYAAGKTGRDDDGPADLARRAATYATGAMKAGAKGANGVARKPNKSDGFKAKDKMLIPHRFAIAMCDAGWYVRSDLVWSKASPMPESVTDRPTTAHEYIFLFTKSARYYYDADAVREEQSISSIARYAYPRNKVGKGLNLPGGASHTKGNGSDGGMIALNPGGANIRSVWHLGPSPFPDAHFATFIPEIPRRCILAGTSQHGACASCGTPWRRVMTKPTGGTTGASWHNHEDDDIVGQRVASAGAGDNFKRTYKPAQTVGWEPSCDCGTTETVPCVVLDIFGGSGTTGMVADKLGRDAILIELQSDYIPMIQKRISDAAGISFESADKATRPAQVAMFGGLDL